MGGLKKRRKRTEKGPKKALFGTWPKNGGLCKKGASALCLETRIPSTVQLDDVIFLADERFAHFAKKVPKRTFLAHLSADFGKKRPKKDPKRTFLAFGIFD